jgi:hypothetical protein
MTENALAAKAFIQQEPPARLVTKYGILDAGKEVNKQLISRCTQQ